VEPKKFNIIFSPAAQRDIERLDLEEALQIARDTKNYLKSSPSPLGKTRIKKLTGFDPPLYRLRSGDYRAYYRVVSRDVIILAITHKKDSEKYLRRLRS
jgi:mRNA-degrading endonuclease RelE of RelBE toxin-antitoxin system